jgi:hypothetical protein
LREYVGHGFRDAEVVHTAGAGGVNRCALLRRATLPREGGGTIESRLPPSGIALRSDAAY